MATYTGINHLAMVTKDMDMTVRFWRDFLGMRLVAGLGTGRYRHYFFEISAQDMRKHPKMLDRNPSPTAREGSEPVPGRWSAARGQKDRYVYPGEGTVFREKGSTEIGGE
jgi:catechol 2,3-dioxygenase-like lactoylglutathione lyase family enzyme